MIKQKNVIRKAVQTLPAGSPDRGWLEYVVNNFDTTPESVKHIAYDTAVEVTGGRPLPASTDLDVVPRHSEEVVDVTADVMPPVDDVDEPTVTVDWSDEDIYPFAPPPLPVEPSVEIVNALQDAHTPFDDSTITSPDDSPDTFAPGEDGSPFVDHVAGEQMFSRVPDSPAEVNHDTVVLPPYPPLPPLEQVTAFGPETLEPLTGRQLDN